MEVIRTQPEWCDEVCLEGLGAELFVRRFKCVEKNEGREKKARRQDRKREKERDRREVGEGYEFI